MSLMTSQSVHLSTCDQYRIKADHMVVGENTRCRRTVFTLDIGDGGCTRLTIFATREQLLEIEMACSRAVQDFDETLAEGRLADAAAEQARQESAVGNLDNADAVLRGEADGVDLGSEIGSLPDILMQGDQVVSRETDFSNGLPMTPADFRHSE